jgi:SulP family sulfate permease
VARIAALKPDLAGGGAAAALTLPVGIALGVVTLEPLGASYGSLGVAAGVYGVILCALLPVLFGSRGTAINVPRSVTAVFVAAMILEASVAHRASASVPPSPEFVYAATFLFLALSGAFQALIGVFRLGTLVKYLPHAVLAGFMNAVAVLLVLAQLPALLGMPPGAGLMDLVVAPGRINAGAFVVALVTLGALGVPKILPLRVPPLIVALIAGTLAHHLLAEVGFNAWLGPMLGEAPPLHPRLDTAFAFREVLDSPAFLQVLPSLAASAFGLALIVSLDSLLLMKSFERVTHERVDSQRELARLGIANTLSACVGAIPCSMSLAASQANHKAGGRTAASVVMHGLIALVVVLAFGQLIAAIPRAVVAALLVSIAWGVIDRPTLATIRQLAGGRVRNRARLATDVLVMLTVASIAMLLSVPLAVAVGVLIAMLSFMVNMSHSVVRRLSHGDALRSRRSRSASQTALLNQHGRRIVAIELEGVIFFGTADDLLETIDEQLKQGARYVVLDIGRVSDVDTTGAQMLIQINEHVRAKGGRLLVSQAAPGLPQWDFLVDTGVVRSLGDEAFAPDTDRALEVAENALIAKEVEQLSAVAEIPLRLLQPFALLTDAELAQLRPRLTRRTFGAGEFVFREGDPGNELFVIAMGTASVRRAEGVQSHRLVTFGEGTVFGELALLDEKPRSASVQADGPVLVCYVMSRREFDDLVANQQAIALKLMLHLAQELGGRLRFANETINHLKG